MSGNEKISMQGRICLRVNFQGALVAGEGPPGEFPLTDDVFSPSLISVFLPFETVIPTPYPLPFTPDTLHLTPDTSKPTPPNIQFLPTLPFFTSFNKKGCL